MCRSCENEVATVLSTYRRLLLGWKDFHVGGVFLLRKRLLYFVGNVAVAAYAFADKAMAQDTSSFRSGGRYKFPFNKAANPSACLSAFALGSMENGTGIGGAEIVGLLRA